MFFVFFFFTNKTLNCLFFFFFGFLFFWVFLRCGVVLQGSSVWWGLVLVCVWLGGVGGVGGCGGGVVWFFLGVFYIRIRGLSLVCFFFVCLSCFSFFFFAFFCFLF